MANNLSVKISADETNLTAAMARARAELSSYNSALRAAAQADIQFAGANAAASQALQQAAENAARAQARVAGLRQEFQRTRETSAGLGGSLEAVRASLSNAFQITGIAAAAAGVMKVGEAIESLGARAIEIRTLSTVLGVSTSQLQAMEVAAEESGIEMTTLARAGEHLTVMLNEARNGSGKAVEKLLALGITTKDIASPTFQLNDALAVLKVRLEDTNTAEATRKALLQDLGARGATAIQAIKEYDGSQQGVAAAMGKVNGLSDQQIDRLAKMKIAWSELEKGISNNTSKILASVGNVLAAYKQAVLAHNPQLDAANQGGSGGSVSGTIDRSGSGAQQAAQASARAQEALRAESLHDEMEKIKEGVAAFEQGSAQRLAALQRYAALAKQYYGGSNVDEVRKANSEVLAAERELRATQGREAVAAAREQAQAIAANASLSLAQRAQAERAVWVAVLSNDRIVGAQRVEAAREFSREMTEIAKQSAAQDATIARQNVAADISISKMKVEAAKEAINQTSAADSAAVAARLARLRELTAQEFVLNERELENELATLNTESAAYNAVYNQIRELKEKLVVDLAKLDKEAAAENKRVAQEEVTARKMATNEILSAEGTLVSNLLNRRQSFARSILQIGQQMVTQEIANDLKAATLRLIIQDKSEAQTKASMQGGLLYHAAVEFQKMLATARAQAAQTARRARAAGAGSR